MYNESNDEEKKLDWMYKGPNSNVSREEYLLGRKVDKTLDQLNEEEKLKQQGLTVPKNKVEHECIPPSIRDFNKVVQSEQVDLSTKLQEDPLVAIKKREEETRRQFLQNPVQLKKLQKALKAQQAKKKKKNKKKSKKSSESESDLDKKLAEKLLNKKSTSKEEKNLDIILMHKYEALKDKITESDLRDILNGHFTDSDDSSNEEKRKKSKEKHQRKSHKTKERKKIPQTSSSETDSQDDSDSSRPKQVSYGLVKSDGTKIPLFKNKKPDSTLKTKPTEPPKSTYQKHKSKKLTEEEKEKMRREMMRNAQERDKERERNVKRYRQEAEREKKDLNFDPEFVNKQLLKSANTSSVESRIKSNLGKIQRSSRDMDRNFSKR